MLIDSDTCEEQVLEGNPHHVKGLFRRGTAYMETGDFDEARADFKQVRLISSLSCLIILKESS
jgi:hypothetical protein